MSTYVQTKNEILYIYNTVQEDYEPIVCLTSHNISHSVDEISSRTKCDANGATQRRAGAYTYEIGFDGVYSEFDATTVLAYEDLRANLLTLGNFTWKIETKYKSGVLERQYGTGYFASLEKTAEIDSDVTFSGSIMGSGIPTDTDPEA